MERSDELPAFVKKEIVLLGPVEAICNPKIQNLCRCPYYKHPKGCPNYGVKAGCPPNAKFFPEIFEKEVFIAAVVFDFGAYLKARRQLHPSWSERALRNPRHWQGHLRANLRKFVKEKLMAGYVAVFNPEAMGVNVTTTCRNAGLKLEWPPKQKVCEIALFAKNKI